MKKQLHNKNLFCTILLSFLLLPFTDIYACTGFDVLFTNITVTNMNASSDYTYNYTIKNIATQAVALKNLLIQNYVSTTATTSGEKAAGGSYINLISTDSIQPGASYSGSFNAYPFSGNGVNTYPYLVPVLEYYDSKNPSANDCDLNNNTSFVSLYPNAAISSVTITNVGASSVQYDYVIENTGTDTLFLNELSIHNYVSTDNIYNISDPSAGSTTVATSGYILANQTYSGSFTATPSVSTTTYSYLVTNLVYSGTESSTSDNTNITSIPTITTGIFASSGQQASATVIWNNESKSFQVTQWNNGSVNLQYNLYTTAGNIISSGNTRLNQSVSVTTLSEDIYILIISDGQSINTKRFIY